jgi:hypothetical protein
MAGSRDDNLIAAAVPNPVVGQTYTISGREVAYGGSDKSNSSSTQTPGSSGSNNTRINKDTLALIQKGFISQPGFYGNQELKASNDSFNNAVQIGAQLFGSGASLRNTTAPANYVRTDSNYILTTLEKQAIQRKSQELASYGIIPYDALENFFYILAANENYNNLVEISNTIGVPELADKKYIRNIIGVVGIPDIYKIGYLSQGVASVNQRYSYQYAHMSQYDDISKSSIGDTLQAAELGIALGVLGPSIVSTAYQNQGYRGNLGGFPGLSTSSIGNAINTYVGVAGGTASVAALASVSNPTTSVPSLAAIAGGAAIGNLLNQTPLGGALGSLGSLGGVVAGALLSQSGGGAMGGFLSEVLIGTRIATSKRANNPMLQPPSYAGKSFFGEAPVALPAIDQIFSRRIGAFSSMGGGSGVVSFGMQNFASFGGSLPISSIVSRMVTGSSTLPPQNTYFGQHVATMNSNLCNVMNVPSDSMIEMRRSDNAIPFMLGFSAVMVGETFSPFGSSPFTGGWRLAASTANDIQRYNPAYLRAVQTSL